MLPPSTTTTQGLVEMGNAGLLSNRGSGSAHPGAGAQWDLWSILTGARRTSKAPQCGGMGREMREGTAIPANSGEFSGSAAALQAEEPQVTLSLPRCSRGDHRLGFVMGS